MDWRVIAGGEEGKCYCVNKELFPDMEGFMRFAHSRNLSLCVNRILPPPDPPSDYHGLGQTELLLQLLLQLENDLCICLQHILRVRVYLCVCVCSFSYNYFF
jgi:hypothetical protein